MGRHCNGLHSPLILIPLGIQFVQDNSQYCPFSGTHIFQIEIQLQDASLRFQADISHIVNNGILAAADRKVNRDRAGFRNDDHLALHLHGGIGKDRLIVLIVRVGNGLIDLLDPRSPRRMLREKLQGRALIGSRSQTVNGPFQGRVADHAGRSFCGHQDPADDKIRIQHLIDDNAGRPVIQHLRIDSV